MCFFIFVTLRMRLYNLPANVSLQSVVGRRQEETFRACKRLRVPPQGQRVLVLYALDVFLQSRVPQGSILGPQRQSLRYSCLLCIFLR